MAASESRIVVRASTGWLQRQLSLLGQGLGVVSSCVFFLSLLLVYGSGGKGEAHDSIILPLKSSINLSYAFNESFFHRIDPLRDKAIATLAFNSPFSCVDCDYPRANAFSRFERPHNHMII